MQQSPHTIVQLINNAKKYETEERMFAEWLAFAPFASVFGNSASYAQFKGLLSNKTQKATDEDIDKIRDIFGLSGKGDI